MEDVLLKMRTLFLTIHNILLVMQVQMPLIHKLSKYKLLDASNSLVKF